MSGEAAAALIISVIGTIATAGVVWLIAGCYFMVKDIWKKLGCDKQYEKPQPYITKEEAEKFLP